MREDGRALLDYLKQNFPSAANIDVSLRGRWTDEASEFFRWEVWVHFSDSQKDLQFTEADLGVLKIKLEAEVASRKVLARLTQV
jgi:hypothetical protein